MAPGTLRAPDRTSDGVGQGSSEGLESERLWLIGPTGLSRSYRKLCPRAARDCVEAKERGCQDHQRTDSFCCSLPWRHQACSLFTAARGADTLHCSRLTDVQLGQAHVFSQMPIVHTGREMHTQETVEIDPQLQHCHLVLCREPGRTGFMCTNGDTDMSKGLA